MTETTTMPTDLAFGKVIGRFILAVADGADAERLPDAKPASGHVTISSVRPVTKAYVPDPTTVIRTVMVCQIDQDGWIVDAQGVRGIWLVHGVYRVSYSFDGVKIDSHDIVVLPIHTETSPLDLIDAMPPGGPVLTPSEYSELNARITNLEITSIGPHSETHSLDGSDPIAPNDIGAPTLEQLDEVKDLRVDDDGSAAWGLMSEDGAKVIDIFRRDGGLSSKPLKLVGDDLGLNLQTSTQQIRCIGTSLTAGPGTTPYPTYLANDFSLSVTNHGWSGRNSFVLASTWIALPFLTATPITIPTSGSVTVDITWEYGGGAKARIAGVVGDLARVTTTQSTFTPDVYPAAPIVVPAGSYVEKLPVNDYSDTTLVLEMSRNDGILPPEVTISHIRALIQAFTRRTVVPRVLLLGEPISTADAAAYQDHRIARNTALRAAFPDFYVDAFEWLLTDAAFTYMSMVPTAQDDIDREQGITPVSFRQDNLHPNSNGHAAIAKRVADAMKDRGWIL